MAIKLHHAAETMRCIAHTHLRTKHATFFRVYLHESLNLLLYPSELVIWELYDFLRVGVQQTVSSTGSIGDRNELAS